MHDAVIAYVATAHVVFAGSQIGPHVGLITAGAGDLCNLLSFEPGSGESRELHSNRRLTIGASDVADGARQTQPEAARFARSLNNHAAQARIVGAEDRIGNQQQTLAGYCKALSPNRRADRS